MNTKNISRLFGLFIPSVLCSCSLDTKGYEGLVGSSKLSQVCQTLPDTVQVVVNTVVTYQDRSVVQGSGSVSQTRTTRTLIQENQYDSCPSTVQTRSSLGTLLCSSSSPYSGIVATKLIQLLDKSATHKNVFETACGRLSGDITIGEAPYVAATASFTMMQDGSTVTLNANISVPTNQSDDLLFGKLFATTETIDPDVPGRARGSGSAAILTTLGQQVVPFWAAYRFDGAPQTSFPATLNWYQKVGYDCSQSQVTSALCEVATPVVAKVPALSTFGKVSLALLLALLGWGTLWLGRTRRLA